MKQILTDFKYCTALGFRVFDPPRTLSPASAMVPRTTASDPQAPSKAPMPSPTPDPVPTKTGNKMSTTQTAKDDPAQDPRLATPPALKPTTAEGDPPEASRAATPPASKPSAAKDDPSQASRPAIAPAPKPSAAKGDPPQVSIAATSPAPKPSTANDDPGTGKSPAIAGDPPRQNKDPQMKQAVENTSPQNPQATISVNAISSTAASDAKIGKVLNSKDGDSLRKHTNSWLSSDSSYISLHETTAHATVDNSEASVEGSNDPISSNYASLTAGHDDRTTQDFSSPNQSLKPISNAGGWSPPNEDPRTEMTISSAIPQLEGHEASFTTVHLGGNTQLGPITIDLGGDQTDSQSPGVHTMDGAVDPESSGTGANPIDGLKITPVKAESTFRSDRPGIIVPGEQQSTVPFEYSAIGSDGASSGNTVLTVAGHVVTANLTSFNVGEIPILAGKQGIIVSGTSVVLGSSGDLVIGDNTDLSKPLIVTIAGHAVTANPTSFDIAGSPVVAGKPGATPWDTPVSLGPLGDLVIGIAAAPVGSQGSMFTVGADLVTTVPATIDFAGETLSAGSQGLIIKGTSVSLNSGGSLIVDTSTIPLQSLLPAGRIPSGGILASGHNTLAVDADTLSSAAALVPTDREASLSTSRHEPNTDSVSAATRSVSEQDPLDTGKSNISIAATSISKISEAPSILQPHKSNSNSSIFSSPISVETSSQPKKSESPTLRCMRIWLTALFLPLWWALSQ